MCPWPIDKQIFVVLSNAKSYLKNGPKNYKRMKQNPSIGLRIAKTIKVEYLISTAVNALCSLMTFPSLWGHEIWRCVNKIGGRAYQNSTVKFLSFDLIWYAWISKHFRPIFRAFLSFLYHFQNWGIFHCTVGYLASIWLIFRAIFESLKKWISSKNGSKWIWEAKKVKNLSWKWAKSM